MTEKNDFQPDWVSVPGDTIIDLLEEQNLSTIEFALRMGLTVADANELLHGRASISIEIARRLEGVIGGSAEFWMTRESQYRQGVARLQLAVRGAEGDQWIRELPVKDMIKFGWVESTPGSGGNITACLRFFGVPDVRTWRERYRDIIDMAAFRTSPSFRSHPGAIAAWLRKGELDGESLDCKSWDASLFEEVLLGIRSLTRKKDPKIFIPELKERCAECGVAVAIVRAPSGCRASGATRFLSRSKALLLLSFRYLSDDHFWFTFFHEAGHLLLHGKKVIFLEGPNMLSTKEEDAANEFAARILVPSELQSGLLSLDANGLEVVRFARRVGVSPGIVVGQLQHLRRIRRDQLNNLKRRFSWSSD